MSFMSFSSTSFAVVGQAERFDRFEELQLDKFQKELLEEESLYTYDQQDSPEARRLRQIREKLKEVQSEAEEDLLLEEVDTLKRQILNLPKRDRFKMYLDATATQSSNASRLRIGEENSDTTFSASKSMVFDLSGRRTGLGISFGAGRSWSHQFPAQDSSNLSGNINYNRRYFKKLQHSLGSTIQRHKSKTNEIDDDKLRWDADQTTSLNFPLTRKVQLNSTFNLSHRQFTQEAFDQDSSWSFSSTPSGFFLLSPKSRISAGYGFGANRIRSKAGDSNSHDVNIGYFGRITRKSSASLNFTWNLQTPRSVEASTSKRFNMGVGYVLQLTPKTQVSLQAIRSQQNTTSDPVPTTNSSDVAADADDTTQVAKNETHFVGENLILTFNSRLSKKLKALLILSVGHTKNKQADGVNDPQEIEEYQFPLSLELNYQIRRWLKAKFIYAFNYQRAFEEGLSNREHKMTLSFSANM